MNENDFIKIELTEDTVCDECGYTMIKDSVVNQNIKDNYLTDMIICSTCWDKLRRSE